MTAVTIDKAAPTRKIKYGSMSRDRTWALRWSYFFLGIFAIFSLTPPIYMLITSLRAARRFRAATIRGGWYTNARNYVGLLTFEPVSALLLESARVRSRRYPSPW